MIFPSFFPRLFRPTVYQGRRNPSNYFEGWYYKHVDADGTQIWSIIFGISHSDDAHSFIQIIEGRSGNTDYLRFDKSEFNYEKDILFVSIGNNIITSKYIELDLIGNTFSIKGRINYSNVSPFPQRIFSPGIMGWYTFAPFMECYHGVVSMNHGLSGKLTINEKIIDFSGGKGYIEKDWGKSMPSDWVWMQCNHFEGHPEASMMISIARIPWLSGHFPGFLSFFKLGDKVYRFATYNNSKIEKLEIGPKNILLVLRSKSEKIEVGVERNKSGQLKAPVHGKMDRKIAESLDAFLSIKLSDNSGVILFEGRGEHAGLEVVGDISQYI